MSDIVLIAIVTAFFGAIPSTIIAIASLLQGRENAVKQEENTVITAAVEKKTEAIAVTAAKSDVRNEKLVEDVAKIHELTNSNLTAVKSDLMVALQQIKSLQELVTLLSDDKRDRNVMEEKNDIRRAALKTHDILAVPVVGPTETTARVAAEEPGHAVSATLKSIDANTEETARNTARTNADVAQNTADVAHTAADVQVLKDKA